MRPVAVRADGWGWRHSGRRAWALDGVDLAIGPGERVLLLGASGSGKSTLLAGLAGVLGGADEGEQRGALLVDGSAPVAARGRAGLVLQDPETQVVMARVGDEVAFGCENLGVPAALIPGRVAEALDAVGLALPLDHPTERLSGGQKQRLALASVLAMRPGLLLLDEPTANLDPAGVVEVRDAVARLADRTGATVVVVEHRVAAWTGLVDRVVVLGEGGRVVADGAPETVLARDGAALAASGIWVPGHEPRPAIAPPPAPGADLLSASALAVGRRRGAPVRSGIDVAIAGAEALAVTGPNGVGKSTLALTIAGLLPPLGGRLSARPALADGLGEEPARWRSRDLLPRIGTVFQSPEHQFLAGTVRDELAVGPRALGLTDADVGARVDELLARLRLDALAGAHPFTLSGGQKRRLSVGTALATRPRLLVLDEPTFGQDARTWAELVALLAEVRREGSALVLVTHDELLPRALDARSLELAAVGS
ncbi:ATP-binding cassette domain-containing protein [Galbitalea sp. SE-J8]|uniref:ABC transporter ATP-binding protein n=1 Tax=Galbitalea sp. SE-J8 TaxID=3054952 RepID=UPI00259C8ADC|nr:ATP-binding cassette domain-containing protein [Galbitalea sp. SE-J8]MDM4764181.1 ATP-binding cassette domain-containing protein [Galbitalea sp. SE-J8]